MTDWTHALCYFLGAAFLTNALPHFISGVMGRPLQTPFAKPSGVGLSSATVNILWGIFNATVSYVLILRIGDFDVRVTQDIVAFGLGALVMGLISARLFGRFHGGDLSSGA